VVKADKVDKAETWAEADLLILTWVLLQDKVWKVAIRAVAEAQALETLTAAVVVECNPLLIDPVLCAEERLQCYRILKKNSSP
jgi:hypothetical protein